MSQKHVCPCKVLQKSMPQTIDSYEYHGLPNGTPFAAQEDDRGISYHFDPVPPFMEPSIYFYNFL